MKNLLIFHSNYFSLTVKNVTKKKKASNSQNPFGVSISGPYSQTGVINVDNCTFTNLQEALTVSYSNVTVTNTHFSNVLSWAISNYNSYSYYNNFVMRNCIFFNVSGSSVQIQGGSVRKKNPKKRKLILNHTITNETK